MGRVDPSFIERFGTYVDAIFHDVAHPTNGDSRTVPATNTFFPLSRHKSWFDGHSYATGMFPFGTGKSQESSSEAVNCYYGAYLWSLVRHGRSPVLSDVTDFTRLLLAMEIRGAKTYWQMIPPTALSNNSVASEIYTPEFQENYMVGNVGMLDVAANTWFDSDPLYVHMINAIPITAATAVLFDKDYVKHEYPFLIGSRNNSVEMAWRGYTDSIHSILDANSAWEEAQELVSYELDAALSKSQVLYFISRKTGFSRASTDRGEDEGNAVPKSNAESSSSSSENKGTAATKAGHFSPSPSSSSSSSSSLSSSSDGDREFMPVHAKNIQNAKP